MRHRMTESWLHGYLIQEYRQGDKVSFNVRRRDRMIDLLLPMQ